MRADMGKVITERPRTQSSLPTEKFGKSIRWEGFDGDYAEPKRASGSRGRTYSWDPKDPTDMLGPLKGWVRKQVGRPWDKVYSKVCAVLDKRKLTHAHVLEHLFQWVGRSVVRCKDGRYREPDHMHGFYDTAGAWVITGSVPDYYVHPKTGLLKVNLRSEGRHVRLERFRKQQQDRDVLELKDGSLYKKIEGIWYHLNIREASEAEVRLYKAA